MTVRHAAKRLTLFNHKGGVGKTTLTVNIACAIAELGHRVLIVDSDPQCNITSFFLPDDVLDALLDKSETSKGQTLWTALRGPTEGEGVIKQIMPMGLAVSENLLLVPGDIRIAAYEATLEESWTNCLRRMRKGFVGTTALSRFVNDCAAQAKAAFVFYDTGPNIGPLNRIILLDADYLIVPAACDLFSVRGLKTLGRTLEDWITQWGSISEMAPDDTYLLPGAPRLLGYIAQGFRVYGGLPVGEAATYLARIEKEVFSEVASPLRNIDESLAPESLNALKLAQVKHFSSLVTQSQAQGLPLWHVDGGTPGLKDEARSVFVSAAKRIIERTTKP